MLNQQPAFMVSSHKKFPPGLSIKALTPHHCIHDCINYKIIVASSMCIRDWSNHTYGSILPEVWWYRSQRQWGLIGEIISVTFRLVRFTARINHYQGDSNSPAPAVYCRYFCRLWVYTPIVESLKFHNQSLLSLWDQWHQEFLVAYSHLLNQIPTVDDGCYLQQLNRVVYNSLADLPAGHQQRNSLLGHGQQHSSP